MIRKDVIKLTVTQNIMLRLDILYHCPVIVFVLASIIQFHQQFASTFELSREFKRSSSRSNVLSIQSFVMKAGSLIILSTGSSRLIRCNISNLLSMSEVSRQLCTNSSHGAFTVNCLSYVYITKFIKMIEKNSDKS